MVITNSWPYVIGSVLNISESARTSQQDTVGTPEHSSQPLAPQGLSPMSDPHRSPLEEFSIIFPCRPAETVHIALETTTSEFVEKAGLVELRAKTKQGTRLAIPGWRSRSPRFQEFQYLNSGDPDHINLTSFAVEMPDNAYELELVGRRWKSNVSTLVVGTPMFNQSSSPEWTFVTETGANLEFQADKYRSVLELEPRAERVELSFNHVARGEDSSGPISIKFLGEDEEELLPTGEIPQHAVHGPFKQLIGKVDELTTTLVPLTVPEGARSIVVQGIDWGGKTPNIVGDVALTTLLEKVLSVEEFLSGIPSDEQLLVVDTTAPPMGHATLGLRPNNLSLEAIQKNHWVIFLPFSSLQEFSAHPDERLYQVPRADVDQLWDALRRYRKGLSDTYICSSFPSFEAISTANDLRRLGWQVIYEVRDDMEEFNRVGYSKWYRQILEQQMIAMADKVVSVSRALDEKMVVMQPKIGPHKVIPNGVREEVISAGASLRTREVAAERADSTIVGYVGHLTEAWFDWPLLIAAALELPDISFEIVGHGMPKNLELPDNIDYLGPKTHEELLPLVEYWKVGLIPFKDIPLTHSVDPNKIYEYFAWGLRCVTVQMGSVESYPWTRVYSDLDTFVSHIRWAVDTPVTPADLEVLETFVEGTSWEQRAQEMLEFIGVER